MSNSKILRFYQVVFIGLASYGMLYFSFKFYIPDMGGLDFYQYYPMYLKPLDFEQAPAPFIYRQLGALVTNIFYKLGINYTNEIAFANPKYKQEIFICVLFSNYIALFLTAIVVSSIINHKTGAGLLLTPILGGLLCFLSFFAQFSVITGLSEGWSWFLVAVAFDGYISRRLLIIIPVLLISIFQREVISILFLIIAGIDYLFNEKKDKSFFSIVTFFSAFSFLSHLLVRTLLMPTKDASHHLDAQQMLPNFINSFTPPVELIYQTFLSQNIYMIFILTVCLLIFLLRNNHKSINIWNIGVIQVSFALLTIYLVGGVTGIGNNSGRLLSLATPIIATLTAIHLANIEGIYKKNDSKG